MVQFQIGGINLFAHNVALYYFALLDMNLLFLRQNGC